MRGVLSFHFPRNRYERKSANQAAGDECESEQAMRRLLRLFSKVRARSCSCSSFPNRTRCAGLRFGFGCRTESGGIYTVVMFHKKAPLWGAFLWKHFPQPDFWNALLPRGEFIPLHFPMRPFRCIIRRGRRCAEGRWGRRHPPAHFPCAICRHWRRRNPLSAEALLFETFMIVFS